MASERITLTVPGPHGDREVGLSSPSRVLWPEAGITKRELAEYFIAVADPFLAANGDRPVSLERFPDGVDGERFYSKNPPKGAPDFVETVTVTYNSGRRHPQLVLTEPAAVVWAAQMNTVVFHPWASRTADTDRPVELRIDLDPHGATDFDDAAAVAPELRGVLREAGLEPWVKTSGNRGLHVFCPIEPTHEFLDVRHAVIALARELERVSDGPETSALAHRLRTAKEAATVAGSDMSVTPDRDWNRLSMAPGKHAETWTLDGIEHLGNLYLESILSGASYHLHRNAEWRKRRDL